MKKLIVIILIIAAISAIIYFVSKKKKKADTDKIAVLPDGTPINLLSDSPPTAILNGDKAATKEFFKDWNADKQTSLEAYNIKNNPTQTKVGAIKINTANAPAPTTKNYNTNGKTKIS